MKKPIKICGVCKKEHFEVPRETRKGKHGDFYWECSCMSTMTYMPSKELTMAMLKASTRKIGAVG